MRLLVALLVVGLIGLTVAAPKKKKEELSNVSSEEKEPEEVINKELENEENEEVATPKPKKKTRPVKKETLEESEENEEVTTPKPKKKTQPVKKEMLKESEETEEKKTAERPKVVKKEQPKKKETPKKELEEVIEEETKKSEEIQEIEPKKKSQPKKKSEEKPKPAPLKKGEKESDEQKSASERILKKTEEAKKKRSDNVQIRVAADIAKLASKIEREAEEIVKRALAEEAAATAETLALKEKKAKRDEKKKVEEAEEVDLPIEKRRDEDLTRTEKEKPKKEKIVEKKAKDLKVGNYVMLNKKPTKITKIDVEEKRVKLEGQDLFKNKKVKAVVKREEKFQIINNIIKEYRLISIKEKKATLISMDGKETKMDVPFANDAIYKKINDAQKEGKRLIISLLSLGGEQLIENHH